MANRCTDHCPITPRLASIVRAHDNGRIAVIPQVLFCLEAVPNPAVGVHIQGHQESPRTVPNHHFHSTRIIAVDPGIDYIRIFYHEVSRKVHKDSTITLDGLLYEVPSIFIGERIHVCYDPDLPVEKRTLLIRHQGQDCGVARIVDSYANAKVRRNGLSKEPEVEEITDSDSQPSDSSPSPLDAGLSASHIRLEEPESEVQQ